MVVPLLLVQRIKSPTVNARPAAIVKAFVPVPIARDVVEPVPAMLVALAAEDVAELAAAVAELAEAVALEAAAVADEAAAVALVAAPLIVEVVGPNTKDVPLLS